MDFKTGTLVEFRHRPWVVQQSADDEIIVLKPLGGTDSEIIGLFKPLYGDELQLKSYNFRRPTSEDIGNRSYASASRILFNACRLSFRDIAGPFQCLGRLSFEPRPYQMVPLILALKQERIRLLISDDVGIGKTLESLLIAKELLDRKEINRFAIICLPHLCEQWQNEIKDKFGLDAEIIRSSTVSKLEKKLRGDQNIFRDIPFQVISIDYIKTQERARIFLDHCPDFLIVDEAHTCARPKGANNSQQQRYALLRRLSERDKQLVLLTATPHSGQPEEFQSLIGLLKPEFEQYTLSSANEREELSHYFVQRRRADINNYLNGEIVFPERIQLDNNGYNYSNTYLKLLDDVKDYIKSGIETANNLDKRKQRYLYWDLLALMRGVMSSPDAGISMLKNKIEKRSDESAQNTDDNEQRVYIFNEHLKDYLNGDDIIPDALEQTSTKERSKLKEFITTLESIKQNDDDAKVRAALDIVNIALSDNKNPIVFCQYIQTAEYVGQYIAKRFSVSKKTKSVAIEIITSRLADEERKMKIDALCKNDRHVLICTDCLSEGVNLQQGFEAIIHYDLPWNPNRVEQRNGRIDRFGQMSRQVLISTMHANNNAVDDIVLGVLYRKQDEIRKQLGVYLPIADDDTSVMETLMKKIIESKKNVSQPTLFDNEDFWNEKNEEEQQRQIKTITEKQKLSHTYFAHNKKSMDPSRLAAMIDEARSVIGGVDDTCDFIISELFNAGINIKENRKLCYSFMRAELPANLGHYFPGNSPTICISFASPTPKGYTYIGRNHIFVEDLSRGVVNDTINGGALSACRAMVMATNEVGKKTTIMLMRVRSVIRDCKISSREIVGEEMIFIGYRGNIESHDYLTQAEAKEIFLSARAATDTDIISQRRVFASTLAWTSDDKALHQHTDSIALERAQHLVDAFTRYRTYLSSNEYQVVEPVLPMDIIAAYVFIPKI